VGTLPQELSSLQLTGEPVWFKERRNPQVLDGSAWGNRKKHQERFWYAGSLSVDVAVGGQLAPLQHRNTCGCRCIHLRFVGCLNKRIFKKTYNG